MERRLLVFAALLPLSAAGAQAPGMSLDSLRPISLQEAVSLAQRNAPGAVQAQGQLRTTSSAVRSAYGAFLPSLSYSMGKNSTTGQRFDNLRNEVVTVANPANYSAGLNSSVDLFDGGRRFTDLRARRADVAAAEANLTAQHFTIALNVKREYANILAARESEAAARAQLEQAEAQLKASVARVQAGAATMSDSLRSVIQVGNARLALLTARNNLRVASASLTRLVGTTFLVTANPSDTAELSMPAIDSATLAQWAQMGPAVRQADLQASAAGAAVYSARTSYLPTVRMSYGYSGSGTNPWNFSDDTTKRFLTNKSLSFSLNFPLFNNFSREDQVVRARVTKENSDAQLRDARLAAQQSIVQQLGALRTAEERIRIQQASVLAAQEDLRVMQQRYALNASTLLDLLTSQSQLNQARAALIQARQDYRISRAQIEAIIGRDLQ